MANFPAPTLGRRPLDARNGLGEVAQARSEDENLDHFLRVRFLLRLSFALSSTINWQMQSSLTLSLTFCLLQIFAFVLILFRMQSQI